MCLIRPERSREIQRDPEGIDPEHCYETISLPAVVSINLKRKTNSQQANMECLFFTSEQIVRLRSTEINSHLAGELRFAVATNVIACT